MRCLVFDAGPIISLTTNNLLWTLAGLKQQFNGAFYIPEAVKRELIDRPIETRKFKFEALQVLHEIENGTLTIAGQHNGHAQELLGLANNCFFARGKPIQVVQQAEMEVLALASSLKADGIVIDERTTRMLIENPKRLRQIFDVKLHTTVKVNVDNLKKLQQQFADLTLFRSTELMAIAYELGLLDKFVAQLPDAKKVLLQSIFWGLKLHGCAITPEEIDKLIMIETAKRSKK